jgi:regulator of ribonuclease activity A
MTPHESNVTVRKCRDLPHHRASADGVRSYPHGAPNVIEREQKFPRGALPCRRMTPATSDLCDAHGDAVRVVAPLFRDYGGSRRFAGVISTVKVHEDNALVRAALEQAGGGRVLVIDGGGSLRTALLGDQLASLAHDNGWAGVIVHGCIRDAEAVGAVAIGVKALATHPRKSGKKGWGERDVPVAFGGVTFTPGEWLAADPDGIVVAAKPLG